MLSRSSLKTWPTALSRWSPSAFSSPVARAPAALVATASLARARVLEMDYEQTVDDLEGTARRLVAWCGLEWEPRCLEYYEATRPVGTASASQVRQSIYRTSVGRWRHYEQALGSLFARLADVT